MSDYGRFDRYGLPDSFDNWLTTPPDYDEPEESEEEEEEEREYWEVLYDYELGTVRIYEIWMTPTEYMENDYSSTHETREEAEKEIQAQVALGWEDIT